jgi:2-methylisocitrate lyase-like PEP mutase family enzyme
MWFPGAPRNKQWAEAGIARVSHGPFPQIALFTAFEKMAREALS